MTTRVRPTGVTILAVLEFLIGLFSLLGGLVAVAGAAFVGLVGVAALAVVALALGVFLVIMGIFSLLIGYGLWTGKSWAWTIGVIFSILGIIGGIISLATGNTGSIVGLILQVLIIYYLTRPYVKAYFGKGPATGATSVPPAIPPPQAQM